MRAQTKTLQVGAVLGLASLIAVGCGSGDDDQIELRLSWWGSDMRHERTADIVEAFEEEHPDISISTEYAGWDGYWQRMATQGAGRDTADIMQFSNPYLREYAERGSLLPLPDVSVDRMDEGLVASGHIDGEQYGVPVGTNVMAFAVNHDIFEEAGLDIPDDSTWTWDDVAELTQTISDTTDAVGLAPLPQENSLEVWLRQEGKQITDENDEVAFTVEDGAEYFQYLLDLSESGAFPSADVVSEERSGPADQSLIMTNGAAMSPTWNHQLSQLTDSTGSEISLLRFPTKTGDAADGQLYNNASMYFSGSAHTEHPDEVQLFIDFMANSEEAGMINLVDRGIPANKDIREQIVPELGADDQAAIEYFDRVEDEFGDPRPIPPLGLDNIPQLIQETELEVLFGTRSPEDAAQYLIDRIDEEITH